MILLGIAFLALGLEMSGAMTLLVVMSPCALALSIPSAILAAIAVPSYTDYITRSKFSPQRCSARSGKRSVLPSSAPMVPRCRFAARKP